MENNFNNLNFETGNDLDSSNNNTNQSFGPEPMPTLEPTVIPTSQPIESQPAYVPEQPQPVQSFSNFDVQTQAQGMPNGQFGAMPQQNSFNNNMMPGYVDNSISVGMIILAVLFPIVGWIYWGVKAKTRPKAAKSAGIAGIISFIISLIINIALIAGGGAFFNWLEENTVDDENIVGGMEWDDEDEWELEEDTDEEDKTTKSSSGETTENSTSNAPIATPSGKATDWKTYKFSLDGKEYQLPMNIKDFEAQSGYKFDNQNDYTSTLNSNTTTVVTLEKGNKQVVVSLLNDTGSQTTYPNCKLVSMKSETWSDKYNIGAVFAGDLSAGTKTSKDALIGRFGEPDFTYDDTNYHKLEWEDDTNSFYNGFDIILDDNGSIKEISLDCYER